MESNYFEVFGESDKNPDQMMKGFSPPQPQPIEPQPNKNNKNIS